MTRACDLQEQACLTIFDRVSHARTIYTTYVPDPPVGGRATQHTSYVKNPMGTSEVRDD